ncbi:hypothetical protein MTBSS4_30091 [Magnetospirillum sp. SS-4]|nr:hypothetical protein MTBSS4_30091 [Magnetospirillum sp. SS-4]
MAARLRVRRGPPGRAGGLAPRLLRLVAALARHARASGAGAGAGQRGVVPGTGLPGAGRAGRRRDRLPRRTRTDRLRLPGPHPAGAAGWGRDGGGLYLRRRHRPPPLCRRHAAGTGGGHHHGRRGPGRPQPRLPDQHHPPVGEGRVRRTRPAPPAGGGGTPDRHHRGRIGHLIQGAMVLLWAGA